MHRRWPKYDHRGNAAQSSRDLQRRFVRSLEAYDREEHVFSPKFEKKMRKLYRRANHPYLYRIAKKVASFLLALLIGGGVWLTVDEEARAAFFGWLKEAYESAIGYSFIGNSSTPTERKESYIPVPPEGYEELLVKENDSGVVKVFINSERKFCSFSIGLEVIYQT